MSEELVGFIGLGNMGAPMATNIAAGGVSLLTFDAAGTQGRAPAGARIAGSTSGVAKESGSIILSLPDGSIVDQVAQQIIDTPDRQTTVVVDTSTIGIDWAKKISARLAGAGITYIDAPVSGGVSGAVNASIAVMVAGPKAVYDKVAPTLSHMAKNLFHVGEEAGQAQAVKLLNNFLSGTAMAATAEAVAFGVTQGIDMKTILDVVHVSSGQNTAVSDKFPNRVLTESYDGGLYLEIAAKRSIPIRSGGG